MRFITLKQITSEPHPLSPNAPDLSDEETMGEDDGLPAEAQPDVQSANARERNMDGAVQWKPITISVDAIRNFYPRAGGQVGTRVLLKSGTAYVVANEHADIVSVLGQDVLDLTR